MSRQKKENPRTETLQITMPEEEYRELLGTAFEAGYDNRASYCRNLLRRALERDTGKEWNL